MSPKGNIVTELVGDWGRWQFRSVFLIYLCKIPSAWFMACVLFTAPTPNPGEFYCHQPENNLVSDGVTMHKTHRPITLQKDIYNVDFCHTYNRTYNGEYEEDVLVPCTSFYFDSVFETAVTKFSLVCSRSILISVAQLSHLIGVLSGGILANILMEAISPRKLLLYGMWTQIITGCLAGYVPNDYIHLMMLRYLAAVCCAQMYTAGQVIFTDITGGVHRSVVMCLFECFWSIGVILLPIIAKIDPNWSSIFLMISLPTVFYIPLWYLIPDSPTWLLRKNQVDKAEDIIRKAVQINNTQHLLPANFRQCLLAQMALNLKEPLVTEWCSLWKGRRAIFHMLALHICWAVCVTNYNGMLLNVKAFGRDYLSANTIALGGSEIIGVFLGLFLILRTENKWYYSGIINIFAGVVASLGFFIPNSLCGISKIHWLMLTAVIPKIAVSCSQAILVTCTTELVTAEKRKSLIFSCVIWARICLLTAPFIGALSAIHQVLSLSVFGTLNIIGGLAMSVLSSPRTFERKESGADLPNINGRGRIFSIEL